MDYPTKVELVEVGPRDGLQNEPHFVNTQDKIDLIHALAQSGLTRIEATSFVSSKVIAQLADSSVVFANLKPHKNVKFSALVPNLYGMQNALKSGVKHIAVFTAASETFNQRNIHCSIKESIERFVPVISIAKKNNIYVRAYISCVLGCPYEGSIQPEQVLSVALELLSLGVDEISFGDTVGVGTPKQTKQLINHLLTQISIDKIAMHFHDTYGQAIANIYTALCLGIHCFDCAVAGLGGCPYALGASGNVATEDVLYLMHGLGIETGVDIYKIVKAGDNICKILGRNNASKVACALLAKH